MSVMIMTWMSSGAAAAIIIFSHIEGDLPWLFFKLRPQIKRDLRNLFCDPRDLYYLHKRAPLCLWCIAAFSLMKDSQM